MELASLLKPPSSPLLVEQQLEVKLGHPLYSPCTLQTSAQPGSGAVRGVPAPAAGPERQPGACRLPRRLGVTGFERNLQHRTIRQRNIPRHPGQNRFSKKKILVPKK